MPLPIYLSVCLSVCLSIYLQAWKRSYSGRLPQFLNLTTSKTAQSCETSSILELNNVKNETILRDIFIFQKLTTSKRKQFCETSFKNEKVRAALTASCQCVLRFFQSTCLNYCACHEKVMPGHTKCCTCHAKSFQQTWRSDAPKCNPLRTSAPGPPNSSDENASLQILFKCPTPAIVFGNATKPSRFAHFWIFWQGPQSLAPATRKHIWTCKSGPNPSCF